MPKKSNFSTLPKAIKPAQPNKAFGKGAFGPIVAPNPRSDAIAGGIIAPKTSLTKLPKITRKPPKLIKQAPPSYL